QLHTLLSRVLIGSALDAVNEEEGIGASLQVVNLAKLNSINGGDEPDGEQFIRELKQLFLQHAPATYEEVLRLMEDADNAHLRAQAHRLKGLAANLAAERLTAVCADIEKCAAQSRFDEARKSKRTLIREWDDLVSHLSEGLAEL